MNFLSFSHGMATGWSSPSGLLLISDDSPLPTGKISLEEASWIASLLSVGGLIGNIFFGFITNRYGRKWPLLSLAVPNIVRNAMIYFEGRLYSNLIYKLLDRLVWSMVRTGCLSFICG